MNPAHVHLLMNHIPVIGVGAGLLLLAYAVMKKNDEMIRVSLASFVLLALVAIPVYLTGKSAEEIVEDLPGVSEAIIENHEEAALISLVSIEILGVVALAGLILSRRSNTTLKWFATGSLAISLVVAGLMGWTANLGGQIRHTEIRAGAFSATQGENPEEDKERGRGRDREKDKDDD